VPLDADTVVSPASVGRGARPPPAAPSTPSRSSSTAAARTRSRSAGRPVTTPRGTAPWGSACQQRRRRGARGAGRARRSSRVLIIDWDVHHGNGTQDIFYDDPSSTTCPSTIDGHYPGTGGADERGAGAGAGFT
jgi:hypothetical protein